ncbi:MAG: TlyA family RNA methyltransferase [Gaiellales bacterium]
MKKRLDLLLVERGLVETRAKAQALVLAGLVPGYDKPGQQVPEDAELVVEARPRFVSRAGEKLATALDRFAIDPAGRSCLDIGASTGGFTDCLLQRGAARVIALDVGYGQLHPRLRGDPRVTVLERTNARHLIALPFAPELIVCDASFIAAAKVVEPALKLATPEWEALVLVKPQFEAGPADVPKGVVRDPAVRRRVVEAFCGLVAEWNGAVLGVVDSGVPGPKGNREYVVHLHASREATDPDRIRQLVDAAVAG